MSELNYHFGPTASDYSGSPSLVRCDGCGCEIGCLTPRRVRERQVTVTWRDEPAVLCDRCQEAE